MLDELNVGLNNLLSNVFVIIVIICTEDSSSVYCPSPLKCLGGCSGAAQAATAGS